MSNEDPFRGMAKEELETFNQFMVGVMADKIVVLNLTPVARGMTKAQALNLAGFLVVLADDDKTFEDLLKRMKS